jgi:pimeloyl-ACP methyl ester carboxylesterase
MSRSAYGLGVTGLRSWTAGESTGRPPVVLLHGGPGLPDYLEPVSALLDDLTLVHRYDQRGVGGSTWTGRHTLDLHLEDLDELLDEWGHERVVLVGHSYGAELAARYCLRRPGRLAGLILLSGPFIEPWHEAYRRTRNTRMTMAQRERRSELQKVEVRSEAEEVELLVLSWVSDHADQQRALSWASSAARTRRPVSWAMNRELSVDRAAAPLEECILDLASAVPPATTLIGGADDPRPFEALVRLGARLHRPVVGIAGAGHEPWLEEPERFSKELRAAVTRAW